MHDRASGHRGLPPAIGAFIGEGFGLQQPSSTPCTTLADGLFCPKALEEVLRPRVFRGKAALKLEQRLRKPSRRSRHDTHPCSSDTDEQLTLVFLFCTQDLDAPDTRA